MPISAADEQVEHLVRYYNEEIRKKKRYDVQSDKAEWETVNLSTLRNIIKAANV